MSTSNIIKCGVDLGTTNSCVSLEGELIPVQDQSIRRSVVTVQTHGWELGSLASSPGKFCCLLELNKRLLGRYQGDPFLDNDIASVTNAEWSEEHIPIYHCPALDLDASMEEVAGYLLGSIRRAVENARPRSTLGKFVVGVPAYFTSRQRQATLDAAHIGGLSGPIELVEEPVCATVAHLRQQLNTDAFMDELYLVADLGGGTTDLSAVHVCKANGTLTFNILATAGNNRLGGHDFDEAMHTVILEKAKHLSLDDKRKEGLRRQCEEHKMRLSTKDEIAVSIDAEAPDQRPDVIQVTREEFETHAQTTLTAIGEVIADLKKERKDVALAKKLLLVGGSTLIPCVRAMCETAFPDAEVENTGPQTLVATGADLIANSSNIRVLPILPRSYGLDVHDVGRSGELFVETVIRRNSPLPSSSNHTVYTSEAQQDVVVFEVWEGESREALRNVLAKRFELAIPESIRGPAQTPIFIKMEVSEPGCFDVTAEMLGVSEKIVVKPRGGLSADELEERRKRTAARLQPNGSHSNKTKSSTSISLNTEDDDKQEKQSTTVPEPGSTPEDNKLWGKRNSSHVTLSAHAVNGETESETTEPRTRGNGTAETSSEPFWRGPPSAVHGPAAPKRRRTKLIG